MILFSIIVHERPEVIVNQIDNFKYFNQGCQFVLHFSAWMSHIDVLLTKKLLASRDYIYFNDSQMWSGHGDGTQMKMHVLNYLYAKKIGIVFEYFCLHASNDMFVKK